MSRVFFSLHGEFRTIRDSSLASVGRDLGLRSGLAVLECVTHFLAHSVPDIGIFWGQSLGWGPWWARCGCHMSARRKGAVGSRCLLHTTPIPDSDLTLPPASPSLRPLFYSPQEIDLPTPEDSSKSTWGSDGFVVFKYSFLLLFHTLPKAPRGTHLSSG